jgi:hypothetical protein
MRKNWAGRLLERVLEAKAIDNIEASVEGLKKEVQSKTKSYHIYKHVVDFATHFGDGGPFSGVELSNGKTGAMTRNHGFVEIERKEEAECERINEMWYSEWKLSNGERQRVDGGQVRRNLLFLPKLDGNGKWQKGEGWYTVVDDCWNEIKQNGEFGLPEIARTVTV